MMNTLTSRRRAIGTAAAALASVSLALTGCSQQSGPASPAAGGESATTTLTMWSRASLKTQSQGFVTAYNKSHGSQVKLTIIPDEDYQTKVGAAAGSRSLPDILSSDVVYLPNYTSKGLFADISDRLAQLPFKDDLAPSFIKAGTWQGKQYAVPYIMDLSVLFYNKDIYTKAGLDPEKPPTSLTEFAQQAETVQKADIDGVSGTFFGGNCGGCLAFTWLPSIWAGGGAPFNADGTAADLNSAQARAVFSTYRDLWKAGAVAPSAKTESGPTWTAPFPAGKVGIMAMPASQLGSMPASTGVAAIPGPEGGASTFVGGDALGISAASKNLDAAWDFVSWTLSNDAQLEVIAKNHGVVARSDLADNEYARADPRLVTINKVAANGQTPFSLNIGAAVNDANGPWLTLVRNQIFGAASDLAADNAKVSAALKG